MLVVLQNKPSHLSMLQNQTLHYNANGQLVVGMYILMVIEGLFNWMHEEFRKEIKLMTRVYTAVHKALA